MTASQQRTTPAPSFRYGFRNLRLSTALYDAALGGEDVEGKVGSMGGDGIVSTLAAVAAFNHGIDYPRHTELVALLSASVATHAASLPAHSVGSSLRSLAKLGTPHHLAATTALLEAGAKKAAMLSGKELVICRLTNQLMSRLTLLTLQTLPTLLTLPTQVTTIHALAVLDAESGEHLTVLLDRTCEATQKKTFEKAEILLCFDALVTPLSCSCLVSPASLPSLVSHASLVHAVFLFASLLLFTTHRRACTGDPHRYTNRC
jgi:hypothetical protein